MKAAFFALALGACLVAFSTQAADATTQAVNGNIYFSDGFGGSKQLTSNGTDHAPTLSPDGRVVAFVRRLPGKQPEFATEIWLVNVDTGRPSRLVQPAEGTEPSRRLVGLKSPRFSTDGRWVYFLSSVWTVSDGLYAAAADGSKVRFVSPANSLEVVGWGQYKGHVVVQKHKYFIGGGSYDWYWLVTPDGKEIGPVGPDEDAVRRFLETPPR